MPSYDGKAPLLDALRQDRDVSSLATFRSGEGMVESGGEITRVTCCFRVISRTQHVSETYHSGICAWALVRVCGFDYI